jgi:hypothetical protein
MTYVRDMWTIHRTVFSRASSENKEGLGVPRDIPTPASNPYVRNFVDLLLYIRGPRRYVSTCLLISK